jgi:hypothetical protein
MYLLPAYMSLTHFTVFLPVTFYRDSMLLATMALLISIIVRGLKRTSMSAPVWISGLSNWVLLNRFGQILIFHNLYPKVRVDFTFTYIYSANVEYQLQGFNCVVCGFRNTAVTPGCKINDPQEIHTPPRPKICTWALANTDTHCACVILETFAYSNSAVTGVLQTAQSLATRYHVPTTPVGSGVARYLGPRGEQSQWPPLISN